MSVSGLDTETPVEESKNNTAEQSTVAAGGEGGLVSETLTLTSVLKQEISGDSAHLSLLTAGQYSNAKPKKYRDNATSKYRGVYYHSEKKRWIAKGRHNNLRYNFGRHLSEEAAALAYDAGMRALKGEKAVLNFPHIIPEPIVPRPESRKPPPEPQGRKPCDAAAVRNPRNPVPASCNGPSDPAAAPRKRGRPPGQTLPAKARCKDALKSAPETLHASAEAALAVDPPRETAVVADGGGGGDHGPEPLPPPPAAPEAAEPRAAPFDPLGIGWKAAQLPPQQQQQEEEEQEQQQEGVSSEAGVAPQGPVGLPPPSTPPLTPGSEAAAPSDAGPAAPKVSKYRGVTWQKDKRRWTAHGKHQSKRHYFGSFHSDIEAAHAYDAGMRELKGNRAIVNFPQAGPPLPAPGPGAPAPAPEALAAAIGAARAKESDLARNPAIDKQHRDCGRRVDVFWAMDSAFFRGTVAGFDHHSGCHFIAYDSGDAFLEMLASSPHVWLRPGAPPAAGKIDCLEACKAGNEWRATTDEALAPARPPPVAEAIEPPPEEPPPDGPPLPPPPAVSDGSARESEVPQQQEEEGGARSDGPPEQGPPLEPPPAPEALIQGADVPAVSAAPGGILGSSPSTPQAAAQLP